MMKKKSTKGELPQMPELLAPAGNFEKLEVAVHYGADAVYLGGEEFSLRAKAGNFTLKTIREAVAYAHDRKVRVYATANIFAHNRDLEGIGEYLSGLGDCGVDGIIIADPGVLAIAKERVPHIPLHLSTQANITNSSSAQFWERFGIDRLNLARELSLTEIRQIRSACRCGLEVFVHGALCISYSGRCMLSNYMTGRNANQGHCAHPCRFQYALVEEKRPGEFFPIDEDARGTYIFNSKDLCLLPHLPQLVAAGVDSLKIEGRMKSIFYVGGVVRIYRAALDYLSTLDQACWEDPDKIEIPKEFIEEVGRMGTRGMTSNFFAQPPGAEEMIYHSSRMEQCYEPVAVVRAAGLRPLVEVRNTLTSGEDIEYMGPAMSTRKTTIVAMFDEEGQRVLRANPGNLLVLELDPPLEETTSLSIFRRKKPAPPPL